MTDVATGGVDLDWVRAQFAPFDDPALAGLVHAENAGGSFLCRQVEERFTRFWHHAKIQAHAHLPAGRLAGELQAEAAPTLARWLHVAEDEVVIGPSTTQNSYVLAQAFRRQLAHDAPDRRAIIVTDQDHEANTGFWRRLAEDGMHVREWQVNAATGRLDLDGLAAVLDDDVAVVAFPHVSNVVAEDNDVVGACAMIRAADAVSIVDGTAAAPHGLPDVTALGADVYLFSAYKTWGPHQGVMTVRREVLDALPNEAHHFNAHLASKRLVPAGPDHAQVAAMAGIGEYLDAFDTHHGGADDDDRPTRVRDRIRAHEAALLEPLLAFLRDRDDVRIVGPDQPGAREPTVSVLCERPGLDVATDLVEHGIMASGGHFYSPRVLTAMGLDPGHGVLRLSLLHYTSLDDVTRIVEAVDRVL